MLVNTLKIYTIVQIFYTVFLMLFYFILKEINAFIQV